MNEERSKLLAKNKRFQWKVGMHGFGIEPNGEFIEHFLVVDEDFVLWDDDTYRELGSYIEEISEPYPDLDSPTTQGYLFTMLRELAPAFGSVEWDENLMPVPVALEGKVDNIHESGVPHHWAYDTEMDMKWSATFRIAGRGLWVEYGESFGDLLATTLLTQFGFLDSGSVKEFYSSEKK